VKVALFSDGHPESVPILDTLTSENGEFHFTPVLPGKYLVKASHATWKLSKGSVVVHLIKENVHIPPSSLVVAGYDVFGLVTSDNEPIKGVSFVLFQAKEVRLYNQHKEQIGVAAYRDRGIDRVRGGQRE
jgi:hypothetical protein